MALRIFSFWFLVSWLFVEGRKEHHSTDGSHHGGKESHRPKTGSGRSEVEGGPMAAIRRSRLRGTAGCLRHHRPYVVEEDG